MPDVRTDDGLLLRRTPYGESSLVVQVLTRRHGRVHLLAKGAYRPTSSYFAVLDLFDTLELEWTRPRDAELGLLRRGSILRRGRRVTQDLAAYRAALSMLELAEIASRPGQADLALFQLLEEGLAALESGSSAPGLVSVVFELGFLQNLGLTPALTACAACGGPAPAAPDDRVAFSAGAGGRLCRAHAEEARASGRRVGTLPRAVLEAAEFLSRPTPSPSPALTNPISAQPGSERGDLDPHLIERVRDFVGRFLDYHLEIRPKSHRQFLSAPNRNAPGTGSSPAFRVAR